MTRLTGETDMAREPRLYGVVDVIRRDRVAGWVIDRTDAARSAEVEIYREGALIATVCADRPRKDLISKGVGTGSYGFSFALNPPLEDGMEFTLSVTARSHDGIEVSLQPAAGAARSLSAERRALGRIIAELTDLRKEAAGLREEMASADTSRARLFERIELIQLRLESRIAAFDDPRTASSTWLGWVGAAGAVMAVGGVLVGVYSLY